MAVYGYSYKGVDEKGYDKIIEATFDLSKDTVLLQVGYQEVIVPLEVIDHLQALKEFTAPRKVGDDTEEHN